MSGPVIDLPLGRTSPPTLDDLLRWTAADTSARPTRLARFRERLAAEGVDAYLGVRRENSRYLTGFVLGEGEEKVAGFSGQFLVSADETVVFADSRYRVQARDECPDARVENVYGEIATRWPELIASLRPVGGGDRGAVRRLAVEAGFVSHATWMRLASATPDVELVPAEGWIEALRQVKEPAELERIGSACAVADAALTRLLPVPGWCFLNLMRSTSWRSPWSGRCARMGQRRSPSTSPASPARAPRCRTDRPVIAR